MRRSRLLPIVLFALVLAGCGNLQVTGSGSGGGPGGDGSPGETSTQRHDVAISRVEVDSDAGTLEVRAGADGSATVDRTLRWTGDRKPVVTETVEGTTLKLSVSCPGRGSDRCEAGLVVTVPAAAAVRARLQAGDVAVSGLSGDQDLSSQAGGVRGEKLGAAEVAAETSAGGVDLAFATAPRTVDARSSAGSVSVKVPGGPYAVTAESSVGGAEVTVPTDPGAPSRITARSSAGEVTVEAA
ncbi:MAG: hypothetical protein J0I34_21435 [Pseudonocardia sp.]|uniref:hypothetical protein n=1 Tax=unclassified Pseudonocardia TaxID=2619320 RepID=UPI0008685C88|nr:MULTISPECIES: hypothetical protein [unclassified Pseudonocardia]MBN9111335.1 hypothetical protein [Pseudonocardia sp.]ODU06252.1 MAG: hypothetical protein ABS80_24675 [Pseudonocardia sp. SCN 72-51]ODV05773.1 MAG: hypothetical protein ABT15_15020 [Pseudonocardia sp. SCN 73-27]